MRSRHGILEELDIKCGQLSLGHSPLSSLGENIKVTKMVRGAHLCILATSACVWATIASFPGATGLGQRIEKLIYNNNGLGSYSYEFKTSDGTYRREDGGAAFDPSVGMVVRGEYGYIDPTGRHYTVRYVADANGFQPLTDDDTRFNDRRIV